MLYKKCHRNFVRKFKKGNRFVILSVETVIKEPWYDNGNIYVTGSKHGLWNIVDSDGKLIKDINVI